MVLMNINLYHTKRLSLLTYKVVFLFPTEYFHGFGTVIPRPLMGNFRERTCVHKAVELLLLVIEDNCVKMVYFDRLAII